MKHILNTDGWLPPYFHHPHEEYIFLTSLNLGGAEKIVSDQLWANYHSRFPTRYTLIVLYEKEKEHPLPPNVQIVRLHGKMDSGDVLFSHIAFTRKNIVCHLINDMIAEHLFRFGIHIHLVVHNDIRAWSTSVELLEHPQITSVIAVCDYVKKQLEHYTTKPVISIRHQIRFESYQFNADYRQEVRQTLALESGDIVLGMIGRICEQKNYALAIDTLYHLVQTYPHRSYKLVIAGGFEKKFTYIYLAMLQRINSYKLHDRVKLLGFRRDVHRLVNAFDIALNTSYFEGLSMATQELMGNGLQVVLSDVCGQSEIYDTFEQLKFFHLPPECDRPDTIEYRYDSCSVEYTGLIQHISDKIYALGQPERLLLGKSDIAALESSEITSKLQSSEIISKLQSSEIISKLQSSEIISKLQSSEIISKLQSISFLCYGSHLLWNLINHVKPAVSSGKTAFLTSNLNLGGAQRSLTNLMCYIQEHARELECDDFNPALILINQSNQTQFLTELGNHKIPTYICQSSRDVFDIMKNMLDYIVREGITQIVFWNVESKVKILIAKLLSHYVTLVDVSPGDYIFNEIRNELDFQEAIYYDAKEYYSSIEVFVSKYHFEGSNEFIELLKNPAEVIPNGVYVTPSYVKNKFYEGQKPFKFLVCGRIVPSKHVDVMFEALKSVEGATLSVIGNTDEYYADYYNNLQIQYKDMIDSGKIVFLGYHDNPQSVMRDYDAIIVLGTYQGSPNTVLEAAAVKLPVISNDSGGTKEIIDATTGILLPARPESEILIVAMKEMMDNYPEYIKKSHRCYAKILSEFSMNQMARQYLRLLKVKK